MANVEVEQVKPVAEENVEVPTEAVEELKIQSNRSVDIVETDCSPTLADLTEQESDEEKTETPVVVDEEKTAETEKVVASAEKAEK